MALVISVVDDVKRAWSFTLARRRDIAIIGVIDLVFFLCFAAAHYFIIRMLPHLRQINELIAENAGALALAFGEAGPTFPVAAFQDAFGAILENIALFIVSVFIAWCVVEGYAWYRAHALLGMKIHAGTYLARFSILSLAWLALAAIISVAVLRAATLFAVASLSGVPSWTGPAFIGILVLLVSYVVVMGYLLCATHAITKMPLWTTVKRKAGVFLAGAALIAAALIITGLLGKTVAVIAPLGIIFLVIPSVVFARILLIMGR